MPEPRPRVGCVVLAAGESRRFGPNAIKQLSLVGGLPLVQRAIDTAAGSAALTCTLVVGAHAQAIVDAVDTRRCAVVENGDWTEGIASSLRAGLSAHLEDDACIFMVADQPFVSTADVNGIIETSTAAGDAIVALRAGDTWGTPMLFPRTDFQALLALRGDAGAKRYAMSKPNRMLFVDAQSYDAFADVNTHADHERIAQRVPRT
jgi:molybdenum cofactor cytidylyltransferase